MGTIQASTTWTTSATSQIPTPIIDAITTAIIGGTATPAWSLDQVIIIDSDRYFYLQVPSLLWLHLLDSLRTSG
jgi:hypothetical protein